MVRAILSSMMKMEGVTSTMAAATIANPISFIVLLPVKFLVRPSGATRQMGCPYCLLHCQYLSSPQVVKIVAECCPILNYLAYIKFWLPGLKSWNIRQAIFAIVAMVAQNLQVLRIIRSSGRTGLYMVPLKINRAAASAAAIVEFAQHASEFVGFGFCQFRHFGYLSINRSILPE